MLSEPQSALGMTAAAFVAHALCRDEKHVPLEGLTGWEAGDSHLRAGMGSTGRDGLQERGWRSSALAVPAAASPFSTLDLPVLAY